MGLLLVTSVGLKTHACLGSPGRPLGEPGAVREGGHTFETATGSG
jgi:hypothetical protein